MADDRPVIKQDLDDFRKHIDSKFEAQSEARAKLYARIDTMSNTDTEHKFKIQALEKRLDNFFKALSTLGIGVFLAFCKMVFDTFKG